MKKRYKILIPVLLIFAIIAGILSLSIRPAYSGVNYDSASTQNTTDKTIKFNSDGKLKILHITDTHLKQNHNFDPTIWLVERACDTEKPDIVMLTGDIVLNCESAEDTKKLINGLMNVFEARHIPVAVTFGNHDSEEGAMSREELMAYYNTFSCSVSIDDGEELSGCGTYNIPVLSSDGEEIKFNLWVFDSGDYDNEGRYSCVQPDQIEWYKRTSDKLIKENNGKPVDSLVFQHIIVGEIYDVLEKSDSKKPYAYKHLYNDDEYYRFDPEQINYGTIREYPCPGYENFGQFDAMVEKGDVLAMFTGHDHTNAFGVKYKGIDIVNSLSTRYIGLFHSTQGGYRVIEIDEKDTSTYETRVERIYDIFDSEAVKEEKQNGDEFTYKMAREFAVKGKIQKIATDLCREITEAVTGRQVSFPD
ncbi:MAG: metallophosphoesterase [Clostridia bacterium]|nr:metallophosphoesterase [Clostridia bacterium]